MLKNDFIQIFGKYSDYEENSNLLHSNFIYERVEISQEDKYLIVVQFGRVGETIWGLNTVEILNKYYSDKKLIFILDDSARSIITKDYEFTIIYVNDDNTETLNTFNMLDKENSVLINIGRSRKSRLITYNLKECFNCKVIGQAERDNYIFIYGNQYTIASSLHSMQTINMIPEIELLLKKVGIKENIYKKGMCISDKNDIKKVSIAVGASNSMRAWNIKKYVELATILMSDFNYEVSFLGSKKELEDVLGYKEELKNARILLDYTFEKQIEELKDGILICNDSGWLHIAEAIGVPTVCISVATLPYITGAYFSNSISVMRDIECLPCYELNCDVNICKNIEVKDVLSAVSWLISRVNLPEASDNIIYYINKSDENEQYLISKTVNYARMSKEILHTILQKVICEGDNENPIENYFNRYKYLTIDTTLLTKKLENYINIFNMVIKETEIVIKDVEHQSFDHAFEQVDGYIEWFNNLPFYIRAIYEFSLVYTNLLKCKCNEDINKFLCNIRRILKKTNYYLGLSLQEL